MADTKDLKSFEINSHEGSNPSSGTITRSEQVIWSSKPIGPGYPITLKMLQDYVDSFKERFDGKIKRGTRR